MKMKWFFFASTLSCANTVSAQTNVTLYGVVDAGIRYETKAVNYDPYGLPAATGSKLGLTKGGGMTENYWGLLGTEDLGDGLKAVFQVESHFDPSSGSLSPQGSSEFFQISYVGLQSSTFGRLTLGRQYNVGLEGVTMAYGSNLWTPTAYSQAFKPEQTLLGGSKSDNMVHYAAQIKNVVFLAQYAFGEKVGSVKPGSQIGATIAYVPVNGPFKVSGSYLRTKDDYSNANFDILTVGGQVKLGNATIHAGYIENRRDNNFTSFTSGPFTPIDLAGLGIISPEQTVDANIPGGFGKRKMALTGISYRVGPTITLAANAWFTKQNGYTENFNGSANQYQIVGGYYLSKRSMLYAEIDYSQYRGGLQGAQLVGINGQSPTVNSSQTGMMVGMIHTF